MSQAKADRETAGMRQIAAEYRAKAEAERGDLFARMDPQTREFMQECDRLDEEARDARTR